MWAIRSPKGFGIHPHLAEKRGTLLLQATFGHTVGGSGSGGQSKRYTYEVIDIIIINFRNIYNLINELDK